MAKYSIVMLVFRVFHPWNPVIFSLSFENKNGRHRVARKPGELVFALSLGCVNGRGVFKCETFRGKDETRVDVSSMDLGRFLFDSCCFKANKLRPWDLEIPLLSQENGINWHVPWKKDFLRKAFLSSNFQPCISRGYIGLEGGNCKVEKFCFTANGN